MLSIWVPNVCWKRALGCAVHLGGFIIVDLMVVWRDEGICAQLDGMWHFGAKGGLLGTPDHPFLFS